MVHAEANVNAEDSDIAEESSDDESNVQSKKKPKKEKVGFRDRKVNCIFLFHTRAHTNTHVNLVIELN